MNLTELIGWLLGYENVQSIDRVEFSFAARWAQENPFLILLACVIVCSLAIALYFKYQPAGKTKSRLGLAVLRAALLSLLVFLLAEPISTLHLTSSPKPTFWLLFDGSDSMNIRDELPDTTRQELQEELEIETSPSSEQLREDRSRLEYIQAWLNRQDNNTIEALAEEFRLKAFVFDRPDGVRGLNLEDDPSVQELAKNLKAQAEVTALGAALNDLSRSQSKSNLAGMLVVSDFDQNSGPPPLDGAKNLGVPIYTLGVGPVEAVDIALDLQTPLVMDKGERKMIKVRVRQTGLKDQIVPLEVSVRRLDGVESDMPVVLHRQDVELEGPSVEVSVPYDPKESGRYAISAEVAAQPGEVVEQNNQAEREVNVRDDFRRLMFVEYEPTWEWRFIKEVFYRDPLVGEEGFRTFLRSADPKVRQTTELFLPTLTPPRSEFFKNDVIFLGDMPGPTISSRFCEMVKEFVGKFGGGLVIISGPRFGPGQLAGTPLEDMLPVVVDPSATVRDAPFTPVRTPDSEQFEFMRLGESEEQNQQAWENLRNIPWYQPVERLQANSIALAEHPTDKCIDGETPQPIIAYRKYGSAGGQVIYLSFNETWRLRRQYGEKYYRRFWGQMIYQLAFSHALGTQKRFVVETDRQVYRTDDKVQLTVNAYDLNFEPLLADTLGDRKLSGELVLPARSRSDDPIAQRIGVPQLKPGVFELSIPVFTSGKHLVRVQDPLTEEYVEVEFNVSNLSAERRSAVRNAALQAELSTSVPGGKAYDLLSVDQLPEELTYRPRIETSVRVIPLWNTWLCFCLVVALMLVEWLSRKLVNLP